MLRTLAWLALSWMVGAQVPQGFLAANDLTTLRDATRRDPENLGWKLRLVQALGRADAETTHPDVAQARLAEIHSTLESILAKAPESTAPLRYLCLDAFKRGDFARTLELGGRLFAVDSTDVDIAFTIQKAHLRQKQDAQAADFFVRWLKIGTVPSIGALEGLLSTLMVSQGFRTELGKKLEAEAAAAPQDPYLQLYWGMFLSESGRSESAWKALHAAEEKGLFDMRAGGRHPYVTALASRSKEVEPNAASYEGLDLAEVAARRAEMPDHLGLLLREARLLDLAGKKAEAMVQLRLARKRNPDFWPAAYRLGELELQHGDAKVAALELGFAHTRFPHLLALNLVLAEARAKSQDSEGAAAALLHVAQSFEVGLVIREVWGRLASTPEGAATFQSFLAQSQPQQAKASVESHRALALWLLGKHEEAKLAALSAEKRGVAGRDGYPFPLLFEVHGLPDPLFERDTKRDRKRETPASTGKK